jgi:hypothetical protein
MFVGPLPMATSARHKMPQSETSRSPA